MTRRRFIPVLIAVTLAATLRPTSAPATALDDSNEYKIKAALIFKFIQFVEWPKDANAADNTVVVATVGKDPFQGALEQIVGGKQVGGKLLVVKHYANANEVEKCQVLFVAADSDEELGKSLRKRGAIGLLTVGETEQFLSDGGVIRIFNQGNTLRFEISQEAAAKAQLQISAKLLRLAKLR